MIQAGLTLPEEILLANLGPICHARILSSVARQDGHVFWLGECA